MWIALLTESWRLNAPARLVAQFDAVPAHARPPAGPTNVD
jgi:hypothetical protein